MSLPGRMRRSSSYHQRLVEAVQKRDEERAETIARTIIEEAGRALIEHPFDDSSDFPGLFKKTLPGKT
jgi:DNA-binding GntR family transcriptional regulator